MARGSLAILCLIAFLEPATGKFGVDVSKPVSMETWECIRESNFTFAIVRIFQANGQVDPNAPSRIKNARMGGIPHVSGYMVPCKRCVDPKRQVLSALTNLQGQNAKIEQVWITVKDPEFWSPIKKDNVRFIHEMVNELVSQGVFVGIQTSQSHWDAVTGGTTAFKDLLLWHVQLDNKPNFDGFEPFGGWKTPAIKQYSDPVVICGVGVNKNWDPLEESIWRLSPAVWSRIPM